jgi:hypothetical protein
LGVANLLLLVLALEILMACLLLKLLLDCGFQTGKHDLGGSSGWCYWSNMEKINAFTKCFGIPDSIPYDFEYTIDDLLYTVSRAAKEPQVKVTWQ